MDRDDARSILRWLDTASDKELQQRLLDLEGLSHRLTEPDVLRDLRWIRKCILEEMDLRRRFQAVRIALPSPASD